MKRSCHNDDFKGSNTKGYVNVVETASLFGMEFHKYVPNIQ